MYLRFTTQFINNEDRPEVGIFHAMIYIRDHNKTEVEDELTLKVLYTWFKVNLDVPKQFHDDAIAYGWKYKSLSWFKDSAKEHILKINELIVVLEKYGVMVERVGTKRPGNIVYEDTFQISAIPFTSDQKKFK